MQAEDCRGARVVEHSVLHHRRRAANPFFGRLEDELDRSRDFRLHPRKHFGDSHENCDVVVMSAGVHHADVHALPHRAHLALEGKVDLLGHRQRVHVGAERDNRPRLAAAQYADNTGPADLRFHLEAKGTQMVGNQGRRSNLIEAEFGMLVDIAPPGDDLGHHLHHACVDFLGQLIVRPRHLCRGGAGEGEEERERGDDEQEWASHGGPGLEWASKVPCEFAVRH